MTLPSDAQIARHSVLLSLAMKLPLETHDTWLQTPRIDLSGRTPTQAMKAGRYEDVLTILRQMKERTA